LQEKKYGNRHNFSSIASTVSLDSLGATLSNFIGQILVEKFGHIVSLTGSLIISFVPILLFCFMPETLGHREDHSTKTSSDNSVADETSYKQMADVV